MTIVNKAYYDAGERTFTFTRTQDITDIVDRNKELQALMQDRNAAWRHTASIPNVIYEKWIGEEWDRGNKITAIFGSEMEKIVRRKLADPDYKWLRTDNPSNPFYLGWRKGK
jgi:hypothetical protein